MRARKTRVPPDVLRHKICMNFYSDDLSLIEALRALIGVQSRSAVVRLALRVCKNQLESDNIAQVDVLEYFKWLASHPEIQQKYRITVQLYEDDLSVIEDLHQRTQQRSRSAIIRLSLRVLKRQMEMKVQEKSPLNKEKKVRAKYHPSNRADDNPLSEYAFYGRKPWKDVRMDKKNTPRVLP